jgi:endogenous inhibitor of DNA gyrase (YacG/DUF329 family)
VGWDYEINCPQCGAKLQIVERSMGVPGGKEKEQANCPICNTQVVEHMTDGFIDARLIEEEKSN